MSDEAVHQRGWWRRWIDGRARQGAASEQEASEPSPVLLAIVPPDDVRSTIDGALTAAGVPPKTPLDIVLVGADSGLKQGGTWEPIVQRITTGNNGGRVTLGAPAFAMQDAVVYLPMQADWVVRLRDELVTELVAAEMAVSLPYEPLPLGILLAAPWSGLTLAQRHRLTQMVREGMRFPVGFAVETIDALSTLPDGRLGMIGTYPLHRHS